MTTTTALTIAAWPGIEPRLLRQGQENHADYTNEGGYQPLDDADHLLGEVDLSGLLGRGGAAFPLAVKVRTVRDNGRRRGGAIVVANGEEGEPASIKDRWLLRHRPHLVLDGLRLAARMVEAARAYVYVSDRRAADAVETALAELDATVLNGLAISVVAVEPSYVAGEETAAVRVLNGGPAKPTDKPPRPFEEGVAGLPTLVSNVETLANLPFLHRHGAEAFRQHGTSTSPGTFLATITGAGRPPALYEIPHGVAFTDLLGVHGVPADQVRGVLMGGYFAGLVNRDMLDATLDHDSLRQAQQWARLRRDRHPHRRLPGRRRRIGNGLLRPRKRGTVRLVLQRHGGDVGGHRRRCATGSRRTRTWPGWSGGRWCSAAAVRARRWTAPPTSRPACWFNFPRWSPAIWKRVARHAIPAPSVRCARMKWRR